jgi:hypothetical protein
VVGAFQSGNAGSGDNYTVFAEQSVSYLTYARGGLTKTNGNSVNNAESEAFVATVPIAGWSSNVIVSDQADSRVVTAGAARTLATQTITAGSYTVVNHDTSRFDTHGAFDIITNKGRYTAKVPGYYDLRAMTAYSTGGSAPTIVETGFIKNGGGTLLGYNYNNVLATSKSYSAVSTATVYLNSGDYVETVIKATTNNITVQNDTADLTCFYLSRQSGPAQIAASESVNVKANTASTTVTTGDTAIVFSVKEWDTHGAYNASTGVFTAPVSGKYRVTAVTRAATVTSSGANRNVYMAAYRNGSSAGQSFMAEVIFFTAVSSTVATWSGSTTVQLLAGETVHINMTRDASVTSFSLQGAAGTTQLEIERVGNY